MVGRSVSGGASIAPHEDGKLFAPAAERNLSPILQVLRRIAPTSGTALELASGTGQHSLGIARALPGLIWQPTEVDPVRRASIDAYTSESGAANLRPALHLDAAQSGWSKAHTKIDLLFLSNLLHLISAAETEILIHEASQSISPKGVFFIYGPFKRDGVLTSDGDVRFDAILRAHDPDIGYKDVREIRTWARAAGLVLREEIAMPANNLGLVLRKA
jgi:hypothetical protein